MGSLKYHRPKTIEETLALMEEGVPLAGGTALTPQRYNVDAVIDLQDLKLDELNVGKSEIHIGATAKLQALIKAHEELPQALVQACRQEAALNIRNVATIGGTVMTGDGRSPLLTALLALDASVITEPGKNAEPLQALLENRDGMHKPRLIVSLEMEHPNRMMYEQVSRSPADRPLVCLAVAEYLTSTGERTVFAALGGYGEYPIRLTKLEEALGKGASLADAAALAQKAYFDAGDAFASAAYRAEIAGVLARRLLAEVRG
ncbi:MAG TPA: FAD binding domain-containing protein [Anaerolineales bacterium]|nr:FAD binding domain-containing protein [Anaerolineales bacterium]